MAEWFESYLKAWETGDPSQVTQWMTDDVVYEDVTLGHKATSKVKFTRFVEASFANVPGARFDFVDGRSHDDSYQIEWVMQPMGVRGVSVGRLRDGKICENRDYWNGAQFSIDT